MIDLKKAIRVLVTGSNGFLGQNFCANLSLDKDIVILPFDLPQTVTDLKNLTLQADIIFHFAGANRPQNEKDFETVNIGLTTQLVETLIQADKKIPLVLSSTIQAALDNPYGKSKKAAEDAVLSYAKKTDANVYIYRFPNIFGKWCRPNYNSVVATFCYNAANGIPLRIDDPPKKLTFIYIDDIIKGFKHVVDSTVISSGDGFCTIEPTYEITLGELADIIRGFSENRTSLTDTADRSNPFVQKLYSTFLSYLSVNSLGIDADMKHDARGFFAELIKSPYFGQISISRTKPGIVRGNHWHNTKVEKFIVVEGNAVIRFRPIDFDIITEYRVSGEKIEIIDIPPGYTHNIENVGEKDLITIFWSNEIFDANNPDTYFLEV